MAFLAGTLRHHSPSSACKILTFVCRRGDLAAPHHAAPRPRPRQRSWASGRSSPPAPSVGTWTTWAGTAGRREDLVRRRAGRGTSAVGSAEAGEQRRRREGGHSLRCGRVSIRAWSAPGLKGRLARSRLRYLRYLLCLGCRL